MRKTAFYIFTLVFALNCWAEEISFFDLFRERLNIAHSGCSNDQYTRYSYRGNEEKIACRAGIAIVKRSVVNNVAPLIDNINACLKASGEFNPTDTTKNNWATAIGVCLDSSGSNSLLVPENLPQLLVRCTRETIGINEVYMGEDFYACSEGVLLAHWQMAQINRNQRFSVSGFPLGTGPENQTVVEKPEASK